MYVRGLIPRNFGELAESVPIEAREIGAGSGRTPQF